MDWQGKIKHSMLVFVIFFNLMPNIKIEFFLRTVKIDFSQRFFKKLPSTFQPRRYLTYMVGSFSGMCPIRFCFSSALLTFIFTVFNFNIYSFFLSRTSTHFFLSLGMGGGPPPYYISLLSIYHLSQMGDLNNLLIWTTHLIRG